jgi:hypothetical protein
MIPHVSKGHARRGIALLDCIVYIGLLAVLLTLAFAGFYETTQNTRRLSSNAGDIARALQAGERWREDVRHATGLPRLERSDPEMLLILPRTNGIVRYAFRDGAVLRQVLPETNWFEALPNVKHSEIHRDQRSTVASWRWEVELQSQRGKRHLVPLFTFQAVAGVNETP